MGENVVEVDPAALAAEVDALGIEPAPAPVASEVAQPGAPAGDLSDADAARIAQGYEAGAVIVVMGAARMFAPAWNVTQAECTEFGRALALAAAHWWPDGSLPPKWAALLNVAAIGVGIVAARQDESGALRPLRHRPASTAAAPVAAGAAPVRTGPTNADGGAALPEY